MHILITRRIRSIVDESLVVLSSSPVNAAFFLNFQLYIFINLFIYFSIALMTANNANPIELMHSVASRTECVIVFDNVPFDGHFV